MIKEVFLVGAGSFLGGIARYFIGLAMKEISSAFPWATMTVNIAGCLLIGAFWAIFSRDVSANSQLSLFLTVGFCGGFTTFSTLSKECLILLQSGSYLNFFLYIFGSTALGILAVMAGYVLVK